ncbi:MAG: hypothetical protein ACTSPW_20145 [Promethearchaeota archaeon]
MSIKGLPKILSLMYKASGFLYIARFCWLFLAIYLFQITRLIVTPIAGAHLFLKPVIGVYIFGISGVKAGLLAYLYNKKPANEVYYEYM